MERAFVSHNASLVNVHFGDDKSTKDHVFLDAIFDSSDLKWFWWQLRALSEWLQVGQPQVLISWHLTSFPAPLSTLAPHLSVQALFFHVCMAPRVLTEFSESFLCRRNCAPLTGMFLDTSDSQIALHLPLWACAEISGCCYGREFDCHSVNKWRWWWCSGKLSRIKKSAANMMLGLISWLLEHCNRHGGDHLISRPAKSWCLSWGPDTWSCVLSKDSQPEWPRVSFFLLEPINFPSVHCNASPAVGLFLCCFILHFLTHEEGIIIFLLGPCTVGLVVFTVM